MHEACVCRTRSASRLSRPRTGFPRSEGSGAKFEVYSGRATAASSWSKTGRCIDATPFVELEARVVYRGLEPAFRDLKAQELSLKSIQEELPLPALGAKLEDV